MVVVQTAEVVGRKHVYSGDEPLPKMTAEDYEDFLARGRAREISNAPLLDENGVPVPFMELGLAYLRRRREYFESTRTSDNAGEGIDDVQRG
ncbi:hypothetical protein FACS1894133_0840 [Clostridia bacterium]|nr:hypothetical protein FACS1894133_0840 [Clostridia bacterium]